MKVKSKIQDGGLSASPFRIDRLSSFLPIEHCLRMLGFDEKALTLLWGIYPEQSEYHRYEEGRDLQYHVGRIKYFFHHGVGDPINIDNVCANGRCYPIPVLLDGHHRLVAAILRGDATILVSYGGLMSLKRYLEGATDECPDDGA